jgi:ClpP class serine protease
MSDEKKKIPVRVLDVALHDPWALLPEALPPILKIAARENPGIEVLQDELGVQLDGAIEATVVDGIAIVPVVGPIFRRANLFTELSGATSLDIVGNDLRVAIDNDEVRGIILDVDSPGGQVNGISEAAQLIASYGKVKPIY